MQKSRWTRPAGLALAAAGLVAGGIGIYEGVHSKNLRDDANAMADRAGNAVLYGRETPYGHPSSGDEESVAASRRYLEARKGR